ncbi:serine/threonine-protein kinase [Calothrix sp. 336/3]|uniref:serine/threonine-protein kinase n=1 Tax=Calothrix sp. 336/3 TaxID=1337936 RepID=UPI0004E39CF6|nr:serine/threonine-protein kinase [Calothrix sp. 336/3]AKG24298.1 serine/threonine protein kinase [Calothrix sp. 336/3]
MNKHIYISPVSNQLIAKRYQIQQSIGRGGMGEVFLAKDILLGGVTVAVKFITGKFIDQKIQEDFAREAQICAALSHKSIHIVRVTDFGVSEDEKPFYVMEYLSGNSLKDLIPLPLTTFLKISRQICLGLQCAHKGLNINGKVYSLVHRDIKPANILILQDPILGQLAKILDFGIARFVNHGDICSTNQIFHGTVAYCSPEQLNNSELDSRSDIYSLGVMMYEMLTGCKPWQPESELFGAWYKIHNFEKPRTFHEVNPHLKVPKELEKLILACLEKKVCDRPQNLTEVLQVLEGLENTEKIAHHKISQSIYHQPKLDNHIEQACRQLTWKKNKPIQTIVFPHFVKTPQDSVTALWLMMPQEDIRNYSLCRCYNYFLPISAPHPMLLWVTLIYHSNLPPKWLPCYLDLHNSHHYQLVNALLNHECYPLIFFTLEKPNNCVNVLSCRIENHQQQMLKSWLESNKNLPSSSNPQLSKNILRKQYQQMQAKILQQLKAVSSVAIV